MRELKNNDPGTTGTAHALRSRQLRNLTRRTYMVPAAARTGAAAAGH